MEKILDTLTNCYGEETPTAVLIQEDGLLRLWEVVCLSSQGHGLGNCRCVNHDATVEMPISTDEVIRRFGAEALDGFEAPGYHQIIFDTFGVEAHELETFLRVSYMFGENPLPILRNLTDCRVVFSDNQGSLVLPDEESGNNIFVINSQGDIFVNETYLQPATSR